jgi:hypothetical protein
LVVHAIRAILIVVIIGVVDTDALVDFGFANALRRAASLAASLASVAPPDTDDRGAVVSQSVSGRRRVRSVRATADAAATPDAHLHLQRTRVQSATLLRSAVDVADADLSVGAAARHRKIR